jgi:hypothetical protein
MLPVAAYSRVSFVPLAVQLFHAMLAGRDEQAKEESDKIKVLFLKSLIGAERKVKYTPRHGRAPRIRVGVAKMIFALPELWVERRSLSLGIDKHNQTDPKTPTNLT